MKPQTYTALCGVAAAIIDEQQSDQLATIFEDIDDWQDLVEQAEIHGLSVMLGKLASSGTLSLPRNLHLQLKALTLRHQKVLIAREIVLMDVVDSFEQNEIDFVLLKGMALSLLIYDPPWLRPMRDIDLLVTKEEAQRAQKLLRDIGFTNQDNNAGYQYEHHHLPNSTRIQDGFTISLEVHHDALSGDISDSIALDDLINKPQSFELAGKRAFALGHTDMLKHLCYHTFEPADVIKLGSIVDLIHYAHTFVSDINWQALEQSHPAINNTLRCIHAVIPLPVALQSKLGKIPENWQPQGIGQGFKPLSWILKLKTHRNKLTSLLAPSEWWMHVYYAVPPEKSLNVARLVQHPFSIVKWLFRRYWAQYKSKNH